MPRLTTELDLGATVVRAATVLFALFPAIVLAADLVPLPSELELLKPLSLSAGLILLISILMLGGWIARLRKRWVVTGAAVAMLAGAGAVIGYGTVAERYVLAIGEGDRVRELVLPLRPSQEAQEIAAASGGDYRHALQVSPLRGRLIEALDRDNKDTLLLMSALLLGAQLLVTAGTAAAALTLYGNPTTPPND